MRILAITAVALSVILGVVACGGSGMTSREKQVAQFVKHQFNDSEISNGLPYRATDAYCHEQSTPTKAPKNIGQFVCEVKITHLPASKCLAYEFIIDLKTYEYYITNRAYCSDLPPPLKKNLPDW